jgi:hypothetical protein
LNFLEFINQPSFKACQVLPESQIFVVKSRDFDIKVKEFNGKHGKFEEVQIEHEVVQFEEITLENHSLVLCKFPE